MPAFHSFSIPFISNHICTVAFCLLLQTLIQPPTEASFLDRSQQLSSTKETPLHAMLYPLHPEVGLLSENDALRHPSATEELHAIQHQHAEDHPQPVQQQFDRAQQIQTDVAQQFDPAKKASDWVPFSSSWQDKCKEMAAARQEIFDTEKNKRESEKFKKNLAKIRPNLEKQNAVRGFSGNLQRQNGMSGSQMGKELQDIKWQGLTGGGVVLESIRTKVLTKLTEFKESLKNLPSKVKKSLDDFVYGLRCDPWKSLKLTVTVGMVVVGAVFPAAAVGIVVAGLVRIAVEAAMNAAEEQCGKF